MYIKKKVFIHWTIIYSNNKRNLTIVCRKALTQKINGIQLLICKTKKIEIERESSTIIRVEIEKKFEWVYKNGNVL